MKKIILLILILFTLTVKAQLPDHIPLMNANWKLLASLEYKEDKNGYYYRYFPPAVKALQNKKISLTGYIIPIKSGRLHTDFLLSVLPVMQCQFCGQGDIPPFVQVRLLKPILYTSEPITVTGTLLLNAKDENSPEYFLTSGTADRYQD